MDSTIIGQECIDELADYAGIKPQIAAITERAMRGELDFAAALTERVALLAGLDALAIETCLAERIRPNPGAETLIRTLRLHDDSIGRGLRQSFRSQAIAGEIFPGGIVQIFVQPLALDPEHHHYVGAFDGFVDRA